jgi:quercetin dioxygenase-like cupin family protein
MQSSTTNNINMSDPKLNVNKGTGPLPSASGTSSSNILTEFWGKNFDSPDETKQFEHGNNWMKFIKLPNGQKVGLGHFEPGFGINLCNQTHFGYILDGSIRVTMNLTNEAELYNKGDLFYVPPDHISEIEGDRTCLAIYLIDFYPLSEFNNLKLFKRSLLNNPMEVRKPSNNCFLNLLKLTDKVNMSLCTLKPGWKWSKDIKPVVNTDLCQVSHIQYCLQGELIIVMNNKEFKIKQGDVYCIPAGHDAYVDGNNDAVLLDFGSLEHYAESTRQ